MNLRVIILTFSLFVVAGMVLVSSTSAAQGPTVLDKPQLVAFIATPLYDGNGVLTSLQVTAKFKVMMLMPDGKASRPHIRSVEFDLVQQGTQSVILGNELVDYSDIGADIIGVSEFVWRLNHPDRLPVRRKALRQQPTPQ